MYPRGVMWEFKDEQKNLVAFCRILKIAVKYMALPLLILDLLITGLYWIMSFQVIFDLQVLLSFTVIVVLPILSIVIHEFCHLMEWCALIPGTTYKIVTIPAQFQIRILFYDKETNVYQIIKTLLAGALGASFSFGMLLIISLALHLPLEFSLGLIIFIVFNLCNLIIGGDGRRIRKIAAAYGIGPLQQVRLIGYTILELMGYIFKKKSSENKDKEGVIE